MESLSQASLPLFIVQMVVIVAFARLLGPLARRLGQPMVVAEIGAGILLGPSLLGWIAPGVSAAVFPAASMPLLGMTSQIGLILFMFLIGLELDPSLLRGRARSSAAISYASIVVPFALGALLALRLRGELMPEGVATVSFVLFVAATMSVTAFSVLARILVERRLLRSPIGATAVACAAIDDVSAWCILGFVVSVARASSTVRAVATLGLALGYIALMLLVVRPALERLSARIRGGLSQNVAALMIVGVLLSSLVTELIGIHAVFGAFLFGAVLPKQRGLASALTEKVEEVVVVLFLPLFFAYSGLRTQIGLLDSPRAWMTCGVIIIVACVGKFGGSYVAGRLTGLAPREAGAVGVLMNTRGLMELVVLNIGLDLGIISPALFTMMVVMALVTTVMTTPLLQAIYPLGELAKHLVEDVAAPPPPAPRSEAYTAIICVADEPATPGLAMLGAAATGAKAGRSRLYHLRLVRSPDRAPPALEEDAPGDGAAVRRLSFVSDDPGKDICELADVKHADVVVLGSEEEAVADVVARAPCDVAVLHDRGLRELRRILVQDAGSDDDRAALRFATRIAQNTGAEITVLRDASSAAERELREELGRSEQRMRSSPILDEQSAFDLLITGNGHRRHLQEGATTSTSVVLVRSGGAERPAAHRTPFATVA